MGMVLGLTAASGEVIAAVLANPPSILKLLDGDDYQPESETGSWFSRLFSRSKANEDVDSVEIVPVEDIDLDKSWNGIHYLLTGSGSEGEPPLNFLILGGIEVGDVDVGYGPARAFRPADVNEIHFALGSVNEETLRSKFYPAAMEREGVYPSIWEDDPDVAWEYCAEYFKDLKSFIERTHVAGSGFVISIS